MQNDLALPVGSYDLAETVMIGSVEVRGGESVIGLALSAPDDDIRELALAHFLKQGCPAGPTVEIGIPIPFERSADKTKI